MEFEELVRMVCEVKPSTDGKPVSPDDSLTNDLGLDSLDLLQLGRRLQRAHGPSFVMEDWLSRESVRISPPEYKIGQLYEYIDGLGAE